MITKDKKGAPASDAPAPAAGATASEASPAAAGLEAQVERLTQALAAKTAELEQEQDRYLRERADLENFKKRLQRDKAEALRFSSESLLRELIPVIDNLERAVEHAEAGGTEQPLLAGVRMVLKSALEVLSRHGVTRLDVVGAAFDPAVHEAIAQVPDAAGEPNRVVQQFLPGYRLHERLLRPAQVSVSRKPPVETPREDD